MRNMTISERKRSIKRAHQLMDRLEEILGFILTEIEAKKTKNAASNEEKSCEIKILWTNETKI